MKPKTKILALTFGLILPYVAFAMYFALRVQGHPLPTWFPYFGLSYILATMLVVMLYSRRIHRSAKSETAQRPKSVWRWLGRAWMAYLVAAWSVLFLWGAYLTLTGGLEWQSSVPAGAFLLAFIVLFSWALYKDFKAQGKSATTATKKNTSET
jgi:hypothetical protein